MNKKTKIAVVLLIGIIFLFNFNVPLSNDSIAGKYVNRHYNAIDSHHETSKFPDTLILKPNGTLYSKFYGNGKYKFNGREGFNQKIILVPEKSREVMTVFTYISNRVFENTKIHLGGDWSCYEKID